MFCFSVPSNYHFLFSWILTIKRDNYGTIAPELFLIVPLEGRIKVYTCNLLEPFARAYSISKNIRIFEF
jgi:hypothetical protein